MIHNRVTCHRCTQGRDSTHINSCWLLDRWVQLLRKRLCQAFGISLFQPFALQMLSYTDKQREIDQSALSQRIALLAYFDIKTRAQETVAKKRDTIYWFSHGSRHFACAYSLRSYQPDLPFASSQPKR